MSDLYLLIANEQRGPYSLEQLRAMYLAGTVTSDAFYWLEGQAEWLPIVELFAPQEIEQPRLSAPTKTVATARVEPSNNALYLILLVLVGVTACITFGFYLFNKHQEYLSHLALQQEMQQADKAQAAIKAQQDTQAAADLKAQQDAKAAIDLSGQQDAEAAEGITVDEFISKNSCHDDFEDAARIRSDIYDIYDSSSPFVEGMSCYVEINTPGKVLKKPTSYVIYFLWSSSRPKFSQNSEVIFLADDVSIKHDNQRVTVTPDASHVTDITNEGMYVFLSPEEFKTMATAHNLRLRVSGGEETIPDKFQNYCRILYYAAQKLPDNN